MRRYVFAGNWKMHKTVPEAVALARALREGLEKEPTPHEVVVMPPFTALAAVAEALKGSKIAVGAQNMHWEREGAFTGEISPVMLRDVGCTYVILGHSERRHIFDETDERLSKKSRAAFDHGLIPMVCVGETLAERESNRTLEVVERQVERDGAVGHGAGMGRADVRGELPLEGGHLRPLRHPARQQRPSRGDAPASIRTVASWVASRRTPAS